MAAKQKIALMLIHRLPVNKGLFMFAQAVLRHLLGLEDNSGDVNLLLAQYNLQELIKGNEVYYE